MAEPSTAQSARPRSPRWPGPGSDRAPEGSRQRDGAAAPPAHSPRARRVRRGCRTTQRPPWRTDRAGSVPRAGLSAGGTRVSSAGSGREPRSRLACEGAPERPVPAGGGGRCRGGSGQSPARSSAGSPPDGSGAPSRTAQQRDGVGRGRGLPRLPRLSPAGGQPGAAASCGLAGGSSALQHPGAGLTPGTEPWLRVLG